MMDMVEAMLTYEQMKKLWSDTDRDDPFGDYWYTDKEFLEFIYFDGSSADIIRTEYYTFDCTDNDEANDILEQLRNRDSLIERWYRKNTDEIHKRFNLWWWSDHDIADYMED